MKRAIIGRAVVMENTRPDDRNPPKKMAGGGPFDTIQGIRRNVLDDYLTASYGTPGNNNRVPYAPGYADTSIVSTAPSAQPLSTPTTLSRGPAMDIPAAETAGGSSFGSIMQGIGSASQSLAPFASNIINSFRRPAKPGRPLLDSAPVLNRVNLDADRGQVSREINNATRLAERSLNSNTAEAVRQFNLGQKLNRFSQINQTERNTNTQIGNQQSILNAQTNASNNAKIEDYNTAMVDRSMAIQREQSANFANAADKYIGIQNEKRKADVELQKARVLSQAYAGSGVLKRQRIAARENGLPDPLGRNYEDIKRYGGKLRTINMN